MLRTELFDEEAGPMSFISRTVLMAIAAAFALAAGAALAKPSTALAGTYTVYSCRTPSGGKAPMNGWQDALDTARGNSSDYWEPTCPGPVFMTMRSSRSHVNGDFVEETFAAPPNTTIQSYTLTRAVRLVARWGYLYEALARSAGQWQLVDGCTAAAACRSYGNYKRPTAKSNVLTHTAPANTTEIRLELRCAHVGGCGAVKSLGAAVTDSVWLFGSAIKLRDVSSPQFATGTPSGPLVTPGAILAGVVPVSIGATDAGGGVYQAIIEVDGRVLTRQVLNSNGGACQTPFVIAVPCPPSASGVVFLNTNSLPDGRHSLLLLVTDAAGNAAYWGPMTITTRNNPCAPIPAASGMKLRASFAHRAHRRLRSSSSITIGYRRRPIVQGALSTSASTPVAGASVCVAARDDYAGAPLRTMAVISTNAAGRFRYRVGRGPSRVLYFIHRTPGGAIAAAVNIHVHVPVRVHINAHHLVNGQVMIWRGRLPRPIPGRMLALMQVWRGSYWQTFQQIAVSRSGRWVGAYRFKFTTGFQRYTFRLAVPHQAGYPYVAGASRVMHVDVIG
jgi:hypothetical protein